MYVTTDSNIRGFQRAKKKSEAIWVGHKIIDRATQVSITATSSTSTTSRAALHARARAFNIAQYAIYRTTHRRTLRNIGPPAQPHFPSSHTHSLPNKKKRWKKRKRRKTTTKHMVRKVLLCFDRGQWLSAYSKKCLWKMPKDMKQEHLFLIQLIFESFISRFSLHETFTI